MFFLCLSKRCFLQAFAISSFCPLMVNLCTDIACHYSRPIFVPGSKVSLFCVVDSWVIFYNPCWSLPISTLHLIYILIKWGTCHFAIFVYVLYIILFLYLSITAFYVSWICSILLFKLSCHLFYHILIIHLVIFWVSQIYNQCVNLW